ncbi:hypothetical protein C6Q22_07085 [Burkholderia multivorans]|uniref:Uncharacterized protein n=1 Tax=Burkholderia multivorans TaxID=87883 RepID=A0A8E2UY33_9BURK|nr:hypothetical protein C6P76_12075 [Burkholderia multivorans]PRE24494.1 hypothetical protein C6P92_08760 [Burkholderia multivorans]PRE68408.1 hypothetical protein C6P86_10770 [Burkholderia multivorans]PRE83611.1 hypothetical protein C6Q00_17600 [Burkholderia multivorans]PRF27578.1 hypothetical protein C6P98_03810 [Burkholderia multivorans]
MTCLSCIHRALLHLPEPRRSRKSRAEPRARRPRPRFNAARGVRPARRARRAHRHGACVHRGTFTG